MNFTWVWEQVVKGSYPDTWPSQQETCCTNILERGTDKPVTHSWSTNKYWLILHQWLQTRGNNVRGEVFNLNTFWLNIRLCERSRTSVAVEPKTSIHCSLTTQSTTYLILQCSDKCLIFVQVFLFKYNEI